MESTTVIYQDQEDQQKIIDTLDISYTGDLVNVSISKLNRAEYSKRDVIPNRLLSIRQSLENYGFLGGIFINEDSHNVIDGWHRVELWKELGHTKIPCYRVLCVGNQEQELHLRLNTQSATFNFDDFGLTFSGLNLIEDFGFTEADLTLIQDRPAIKKQDAIKKPVLEGMTKLSTTIKSESYEKLKAFKENQKLANWGDVIEVIIDLVCE